MTLDDLYKIIKDRKKNMPENSYVSSLFRRGNDRIIQKVGEETVEVLIAAKNNSKKKLISEAADLLFHLLILFSENEILPTDIYRELERRNKSFKQVEGY